MHILLSTPLSPLYLFSHHSPPNSSPILPPLPTEKPQPPLLRLKRNHTPLWKEKHIPLCSFDALATFIRDLEVAVDDYFHFVVGVGVDEGGAGVEAVEAGGDGGGGVGGPVFAGGGGVLVCDFFEKGGGGALGLGFGDGRGGCREELRTMRRRRPRTRSRSRSMAASW